MRSSLTDLGKAVRGLALMSADLDAVGKALFDGKVPAMWLKKSFPSLKVGPPFPCFNQSPRLIARAIDAACEVNFAHDAIVSAN